MVKCIIKNCDSADIHAKGMCTHHYFQDRNINKNNRRKIIMQNILGGKCSVCGCVNNLEFDHINRDRDFCIGNHLDINIDRLLIELSKCQLLCHKCHIKKSISERGFTPSCHGKIGHYTNHGCRCIECKKSWNSYCKVKRQELRNIKKLAKMV